MNHLIKAVSALFILALFGVSHAQTDKPKVVVIPLGESLDLKKAYCPPATGGNTIGGPAALYNFCWYLSAGGETCDTVCSDVGGTNLAYQAENGWADNCGSPSPYGVTEWFFNHGNPGNWSSAGGGTPYHTLGYGYEASGYYGKCSTGLTITGGTYPGEVNNSSSRSNVCPCFGFAVP